MKRSFLPSVERLEDRYVPAASLLDPSIASPVVVLTSPPSTTDTSAAAPTAPTVAVVGTADPSQSTVQVSAAPIQSGGATTVTLTAYDANGNQEPAGGSTVVFSVGSGSAQGVFSAVTDNGDGTYTATFTGTSAGANTVGATIDGQALSSTAPTITVTAGSADPSQSIVQVSAAPIQSGGATTVTLTAYDANGNQEPAGGSTVVFSVGSGSAQGAFSAVTDNGDGTYTATFTGTSAGANTVSATIDGQALTSTAPTIAVTAGSADPSQSIVQVSAAPIQSGGAATVTLTAYDADGNQEPAGGSTVVFSVGSGSAQGAFSAVTDNGDGTYTATFTGTSAGANTVSATIDGQALSSTAPTITVTAGSADPSQSIVQVSGATIQSGGAATVTLTAYDADGNQEPAGGSTVVFSVGSGSAQGAFSAVTDNGDGTYTATFTGSSAGANTVSATIDGQALTSTAPTITATAGSADPSQSIVQISGATIQSGVATTVTLTAYDANGNQEAAGGSTVVFSLGSGDAQGVFSAVTDNGDGTYTATFTGTTAGANTITATIDGQALTSAAPTVAVAAATDPTANKANLSFVIDPYLIDPNAPTTPVKPLIPGQTVPIPESGWGGGDQSLVPPIGDPFWY